VKRCYPLTVSVLLVAVAAGCSNNAGNTKGDAGSSKFSSNSTSSAVSQPAVCDSINAAFRAALAYQANRSRTFDAKTRQLSEELSSAARTAADKAKSSSETDAMAPAFASLADAVDALADAASSNDESALRSAAGDYLHARVQLDQKSHGLCSTSK
jgi:hypothetical protein